MKRIALILLLAATGCFGQQLFQPRSALCLNPSGTWIPINTIAQGSPTQTYLPINLYGQNANGSWYGLACDASGNLIASTGAAIPDFTTWSAVNGLTFVSQTGGAGHPALFKIGVNSAINWRIQTEAVPTAPFSIIVKLPATGEFAQTAQSTGLYFYDGTKLEGLERVYVGVVNAGSGTSQAIPNLRIEKITNVTTDGSTAATFLGSTNGDNYFCIAQDSTKMYFYASLDGVNWIPLFNEATGTYLTPTKIGVGGVAFNSHSFDSYFSVTYWKQTTSATCQ